MRFIYQVDKATTHVLRSGSRGYIMPKKSKREKMLADIRRRVRTEHVLTAQTPAAPIAEHSATFRFAQPTNQVKQDPIPTNNGELTAIKKDLTRTVIFATLAIAAELVLFWFERR